MQHGLRSEFEVFLVEDVILTLGNLRGSLTWLATSQSADPAIFRAGLDRLDRQIGLLEDRARALKRQMTVASAADAASGRTALPGSAGDAQNGVAQAARTDAPSDRKADLRAGEAGPEAAVDLEAGPDASTRSGTYAACVPAQASGFPPVGPEDFAIPEPTDPAPIPRPSKALVPVSPASTDPFAPFSDDGDDLNIFGSDPDLLPDPPRSTAPVPFRSRRSVR